MSTIRRRALWTIVCVGLTALGLISITTIPAWPVVGVAVATVALVLNSLTREVSLAVCLGCGTSLAKAPTGAHGRICPGCGSVNERLVGTFPREDEDAAA